jgi:hypothetical protein
MLQGARSRAYSSPMAPPPQQLSTSLLGTSPAIMTAVRRGPDFPAQGPRGPLATTGAGVTASLHPSSAAAAAGGGSAGAGTVVGVVGGAVNIKGSGRRGDDDPPDTTLGSTPTSFESRLTASAWERNLASASASASQLSLRSAGYGSASASASASTLSIAGVGAASSTGARLPGKAGGTPPSGRRAAGGAGSPGRPSPASAAAAAAAASAAAPTMGIVNASAHSGAVAAAAATSNAGRRRTSVEATSPPEGSPTGSPAMDQDGFYAMVGSAPSAGVGRPPATKVLSGLGGARGAVPSAGAAGLPLGASVGSGAARGGGGYLPPVPPPSFNQPYLAMMADEPDSHVGSAPSGARGGAFGRPPALAMGFGGGGMAATATAGGLPSAAMADVRTSSPAGGAVWDPAFYTDDPDEMDLGPPTHTR